MSASAISTHPYFGRAWKIRLTALDDSGNPFGEDIVVSNSDWGTEALKVTFTAELMAMRAYSWMDLVIYNANALTTQSFLKQGYQVTVSAGYQKNFNEDANLIWKGRVFQALFDRENVTDFKVTLHCLIGFFENANIVSFTQGPLATQAQVVQKIAAQAMLPIEQIDTAALSKTQTPRSQAIFGRPSELLEDIARENDLAFWIGPNGINIRSLDSPKSIPDLIFGPSYPPDKIIHPASPVDYTPTLIGTPQQTEKGVNFTVLLDSRIKIGQLVNLDFHAVPHQQLQFPLQDRRSVLDKDGLYVVASVKHTGDTRGNDWYTEVTGLTNQFWPQYTGTVATSGTPAGGAQ